MAIKFDCPHCGSGLKAPDAAAGKQLKCPKCGRLVIVPTDGPGGAAPQPADQGKQHPRMKPCPFCAEPIRDEAIKCKHCGSMLESDSGTLDVQTSVATDRARITLKRDTSGCAGCIFGLAVVFGVLSVAFFIMPGSSMVGLGPCLGLTLALAALAALGIFGAMLNQEQDFACSFCGKMLSVPASRERKRCPKCGILHVIDWK